MKQTNIKTAKMVIDTTTIALHKQLSQAAPITLWLPLSHLMHQVLPNKGF